MKDKSFALSSVLAAFVASLCCLGPLLLGSVGLGAAMVATFAPLRPYFLALSAVLLAAGFYFVYRKPKLNQACEGQTCAPESNPRRLAKPLLWLGTLAMLALAFFPQYGSKLVSARQVPAPASAAVLEVSHLRISGMDCEVCAGVIQRRLLDTPGVAEAQVQYPAGVATVKYDPGKTNTASLIEAVKSTGYRASLLNSTKN